MLRLMHDWRVVAVQDAYRVMPWADAVYGCDARWWDHHGNLDGFCGYKFSTHDKLENKKTEQAERYDIQLVRGEHGPGFSLNPEVIYYGDCSGFQAINLAILLGCPYIVLVGFDMRLVNDRVHFFGDHPSGMFNNRDFGRFLPKFNKAAELLPPSIRVVNSTPGSALTCFPMMGLDDAIKGFGRWSDSLLHRDWAVAEARTN